jgi:molybdenum cofactor guanylyltransferase
VGGSGFAAVVLAGGAGRRLGGARKPLLPVGGRPMLARVLDAVAAAAPRVVVGPPDLVPPAGVLPAGVLRTWEEPPGGGPVAAIAAGLVLVPARVEHVAVLAADLPFLTAADLAWLSPADDTDGAVFVDENGREQWLCGMWWTDALRSRLAAVGEVAGRSLREVLAPLRVALVTTTARPAPWYDCDTEEQLREAEGLTG